MSAAPKKKAAPIAINPKKQGTLRKSAGVAKGATIPQDKLKALAKSPSKTTAKRAAFALNAAKFKKGKSPKGGK